MSETSTRRTALFDAHKKLSAKTVPFGGWDMPVQYEGVLNEHKAVRENAGLFDVSHMGEVRVKGADAARFLQGITINDIGRLADGGGQYSAILNEHGGMIDDLIIYRLTGDEFFICVNASNTDKDYAWIASQAKGHAVTVTNESAEWSQIAVQGPKAVEVMRGAFGGKDFDTITALKYMQIARVPLFDKTCLVARTGYTGEIGFEIYLPNAVAEKTWFALLETSPKTHVKPIGLGARDTLRLEACYLLYGNDMDDSVSPLEAGIGWATKLDKGDFIGSRALKEAKAKGVARKMVAFTMEDQGIARHGMAVFKDGKEVGVVTSGSFLPTLQASGGMALVQTGSMELGDRFEIDVRGKRKLAKVAKRPLYSPQVK